MLRFLRAARDAVRTLLALTVVVVLTIILGTFVIVVATFSPNSRIFRPTMRLWGVVFMKVCGVGWEVEGLEHLDKGKSYVLVGNHQSNLDPPFHIAVFCEKVSVRFLAKAELFKIPLFAQAMRRIGIVETDRAAHTGAHRKINQQVAVVVERGLSLVIYPEGTRSRDGLVRPLKKGAFRIAIDNGMPVVPITTVGLHEAWAPGKMLIRGGQARMMIHEPIPTASMTSADIDGLRHRVGAVIADAHARLTP
ncbi:MAG TPA: lysophospholipid acyltransferase family protein, partial [Acidimicrobiia bacterium]|nr:lysophospholipid acyltransferase family protein [Acidimicrobiia bacterium]